MQHSCKGRHPLTWSTDPYGMTNGFRCDICRNPGICTDGRMHCSKCNFDLCPKCSPVSVSISPSMPVPGGSPHRRCNNNHPLIFTDNSDKYPTKRYNCNRCGNKSKCCKGRFACLKCNFDLCKECMPPGPNDQIQSGDAPEYPVPGYPTHQVPGQQIPGQYAPSYPVPRHQVPGGQVPGYQAPGYTSPGHQVPGHHSPGHQVPGQYAPGQQMPGQQIPGQYVPRQQVPGQQFPGMPMGGEAVKITTLPAILKPGDMFGGRPIPEPSMPTQPTWQGAPGASSLTCDESHPLQWTMNVSESPTGEYTCEKCNQQFKYSTDGSWRCAGCDYDVCNNCKVKHAGIGAVNYPGISSPTHFVATDPSQAGGPATPTVCMGTYDPNGIGFNDYYILCFDCLKQGQPLSVSGIDVWTDNEMNGITYIWVQYRVTNAQGVPETYDLEHGMRPASDSFPHKSITLGPNDYITNITGKFANDCVIQLAIQTTRGPLVMGRNEGMDFDLRVPAGRRVVALASQFTSHLKCIGAYYV
eukprot:TRINITY_DN313_c0_g1_i1.p1 TRINITY_DN313_c0_g1~~TRINITY_DN313_c0_g1_i1.p1  ORF type:complete len:524 (-),score=33.40 TRINITY_DN313_c0_g1_i1:186-1757(-)